MNAKRRQEMRADIKRLDDIEILECLDVGNTSWTTRTAYQDTARTCLLQEWQKRHGDSAVHLLMDSLDGLEAV